MTDISISIEAKKTPEISKKEMRFMNLWREIEFGTQSVKDFKEDYPDSVFFFVKSENKILAFGTLVPLKISYLGREYNLMRVCNIISVEKGKGFGRMLVYEMERYMEANEKTGLGFCPKNVLDFYLECGFSTREGFSGNFRYENPLTGELKDCGGEAFFFEGSDGFIRKAVSFGGTIYLDSPFW